ncbi:ead/Ea22-like family protein [Pseudomonas sp. CDFA 602]|uniref:ead/Ea22-like family protein n=1 Tax=Pseudomonas californiensis TaxID=2829823 RepID=UPI001E5857B4|nr:ead/Ea22-like family protein [Pseudomonas californiensis]MCD5994171.1 ead/Ea22-like family protein [Pseudomonas californiensis]MCD5999730.1 ead/Ea22-like family protein [Pseudomonas californiensis]
MTVDIEKLEALARAATQGEWTCSDKHDGRFWHIGCGNQAIGSTHAASKKANPRYAEMFEANAKFIAAANPAAVLSLIAENESAHKHWQNESNNVQVLVAEVVRLKAENEALRKIISESATACGAAVSVDCSLEFMAMLPTEIGLVVGRLRKSADRYEWFRSQHWDSSAICAVVDPKLTTKLGAYCPSGKLLDDAVDAGISMSKEASHD